MTGAATSMEDLSGDPTVTLGLRLMGAVGQVKCSAERYCIGGLYGRAGMCGVVNFIAAAKKEDREANEHETKS